MKPFISAVVVIPALLLATAAGAAERVPNLDIAAKPLPAALVELAAIRGLSIGGVDPVACSAKPLALKGRFSSYQALRRLLKDSACDVQPIDAVTFRLVPKAKPVVRPVSPTRPVQPRLLADEDIAVVIVRRQQSAARTPAAVNVVAPPLLSGNDTDLSLIAAHVPGMMITNLGPGRDKILLRGLSDSVLTGRTQSTTGLYLDDAPITYNAPDPDLLLVDMARIEVLKGPQGNLYGQGALSGVVRLVTQKPRLNLFEGEVGAAVGFTQHGKESWRATTVVNLPLIKDQVAMRVALYEEKTGGFIKGDGIPQPGASSGTQAAPDPSRQATNTTERSGGRVMLTWQIAPDTRLDATAVLQNLTSSNSQYVMGQRGPYRRPVSLTEPHNNRFNNLSLGLTKDMDIGTLKVTFNQLRHKVRSGYDAQPVGRYVSIPNSGILYFEEDQFFRMSSLDASLVSRSDQRFRWLAGVFAARSDEVFTPHLTDFYTKHTLYDELRKDRISDVAVFGRLTYDVTPRWSLSAGLRIQRSGHETDSRISNVRLVNYRPQGHIEDDMSATPVSHELMVSYQASDRLLLYALSSNGFRTGGFNTTTLITTAVSPAYRGDKLSNREAGVKYHTVDNHWRVNLSVFKADWTDIQSDQLRATGLPITLNIGDGSNMGVEFDTEWRPLPALTLQLIGQYNDPRLDRVNPLFPKLAGGGMPYMSRASGSLNAQWSQSLKGLVLRHSAILAYRGRSPLNYPITQTTWMRGYTNLELTSSADIGRYTVSARVTNATGAQSNSFAYGNPFASGNQITPLRPRTLWLAVTGHF
ncbi:TonB-dependent receptor [Asticcacaulis sp. 201]|uniref:TonB-dependent receptor n=1 Tax=Asticcacaulis sp. 201 TaxID=3028787 RepID=UPI002916E8A1|nr:TonB-dependent receptor [Asticcacaulis sp. 201]MDV6332309.1 TonB-dependent receptor [Asticcacaulis sp. 201]